jgi:hypothetical protein
MSTAHRTVKKRFGFVANDKTKLDVRIQDGTNVTSALSGGSLVFTADVAADQSTVDLGDNGIAVADLLSFEAVLKVNSFDEQLDIRVGMASAYNVDPDVISEVALFKLRGKAGAANANDVFIETRDTNRDLKGTATNKSVLVGQWAKYKIDFATGIQSISAPALSKGGLGSVQFQASRESSGNVFSEHVTPGEAGKHMDMSDAVGPLQPFVQVRLLAAPGAAVTVELREMCLTYRSF